MKQSGKKRGHLIAIIIAVCAAAGCLVWFFLFRNTAGGKNQEIAYVETIANLTGLGSGSGMINRYAGVVEAQESWSVQQNADAAIKEIKVKAGDEVKKGDALFTYDVDKYQADLDQAEIDLERLENELQTAKETIEQLEKEKKKVKASEQGSYTIQIKEQELTVKQTELDIESKKQEISKFKENIKHSTVTSEIDGVVKTVNSEDTESDSYSESDNSLITIMRTGDYRVKGTINEQNIGTLSVGADIIVHSRTNSDQTWKGTIEKIDMDNAKSGNQDSYYGMDSGSGSTTYPFYVDLEQSDGLMLGQHVYMELDLGQEDIEEKQGLWVPEYLIDMTDEANPFVWADNDGKLEKRKVVLGEYDEELMEYQVTSGLTAEDAVAMPDERLKEGMVTKPMAEMPDDYDVYGEDGESDEGYDDEDMSDDDSEIEADEDWGTEEGFEGMDGYQGIEDDADFDEMEVDDGDFDDMEDIEDEDEASVPGGVSRDFFSQE